MEDKTTIPPLPAPQNSIPAARSEAELREALARPRTGRPALREPERADTCRALAQLVAASSPEEAEKFYCEALDIYKKLAERLPAAYEPKVALTCDDLGLLLSGTSRQSAAEWFFRVAVDTYRRLAERDSMYAPDVARSCHHLATFLSDTGRAVETERLYRVALDTRRRLWEQDPGFAAPLADTCFALGLFLLREKKPESLSLFREALALYESAPGCSGDADRARRVLERFFAEN